MKWRRILFLCLSAALLSGVALLFQRAAYQAADEPYNRQTEIVTAYTQYEWWLSRWADGQVVCQVYTDHEGWPTPNEIQTYCGQTLYQQWQNTKPCPQALEGNTTACSGLYLHQIAATPQERTIVVDLPEPQVWLSLGNCERSLHENVCAHLPTLVLRAEEPLPNETITAIHGTLDGEPFSCAASVCEVPLQATSPEGVEAVFWADSSYGDSSPKYNARIRVVDTGVPVSDESPSGWYVDVLSSRWDGGEPPTTCAQAWQSFPALDASPPWLANPQDASALVSNEPYVYLAGQLIAHGLADASACPDGGLLPNGWANACGLEAARPVVDAWQNRFDTQIIAVAQERNLPAQLLKNLFAQESQFWPGAMLWLERPEFGMGHLTEQGADTVLLWNPDFFASFCPLVLDTQACALGYDALDAESKALLRGAVTVSINPSCDTCPGGIDLSQSQFSIDVFAQTLEANCAQTGQLLENLTGRVAGDAASYADLWRFTLANYHAGAGCLQDALQKTKKANQSLTWEHVSRHFSPGCKTAVTFVKNITNMQPILTPTPLPTVPPKQPTATTLPPTPFPTAPGAYPPPGDATRTPGAYPPPDSTSPPGNAYP